MATGDPDIRVRLSPEGQAEVIAALRAIQKEGRGASESAAKGTGLVAAALREIKTLLPALGLAAAVTGIVALGRHSLQSADEIGKMADRVGTTAETLSVLDFGARTANVSREQLGKGLVGLTNNLQALRRGTIEQVEAFDRLGLSADDFVGKDTGQAFELIANRLGKMENGLRKTQIASDIFGQKLGPTFITLLNDVAKKGFGLLALEAEQSGSLITGAMAKTAHEVGNSMTRMKQRTEGLANQFLSGFAPAVDQALKGYEESVRGKGLGVMKEFGEGTARVLSGIVGMFKLLAHIVAGVFSFIGKEIGASAASWQAILTGNFREAASIIKDRMSERLDDLHDGFVTLFEDWDQLFKSVTSKPLQPPPGKGDRKAAAEGGLGTDIDQRKTIAELDRQIKSEEIKKIEDLAKLRRGLADEEDKAERARLEARLAGRSRTLDALNALEIEARRSRPGAEDRAERDDRARLLALVAGKADALEAQRELERFELASLQRRATAAADAFRLDSQLIVLREEGRREVAIRQEEDERIRARLLDQITIASNAARLESAKTYYSTLNALEADYLKIAGAAREKIAAADHNLADSLGLIQAARQEITRSTLTEEQKAATLVADAWAQEAALQQAALQGNTEAAKKANAELVRLAKEISQAGQADLGLKLLDRAGELVILANAAEKLNLGKIAREAEQGAESIREKLAPVKAALAELSKEAVFEVKPIVTDVALKGLVQRIQNELGANVFEIAVRPTGGGSIGVPGFATGGMVPGVSPYFTADDKLLWGTSGEYIMQVPAVRHYGADFMRMVNQMQLPRFAEGGLVGGGDGPAGGGLQPVNVHLGGRSVRAYTATDDLDRFIDLLKEARRGSS